MYADIIVETKTPAERPFFTYKISSKLEADLKIGSLVLVPFGRRQIRGLIIKIHDNKPGYPTKELVGILAFEISKARIATILWISKYYFCSLGEAFKFFLPPSLVRARKISDSDEKTEKPKVVLNKEQNDIFKHILLDWKNGQNKHLLLGVTGSGKTEVYIKLILECLKTKGQTIYLLPEIFLASVILKRLKSIFGNKIAIVHSKLSKSELSHIYQLFYNGTIKILVGPRSAISFLPNNLKLVIIDEEHDNSYKQEQSPRYDARLLAEKISELENCSVLFGTATPRIETYFRSGQGEIKLYHLKERFEGKLPEAQIVDMRAELKSKNYSLVSEALQQNMEKIISEKRQAILFLNRRGMATFVSCRDCGHVEMCPNCSLPLVHHLAPKVHLVGGRSEVNHGDRDILECHQCSYELPLPTRCPNCRSALIKSFGTGIQKVETEIRERFPKTRILRLDTDLKETELKKTYELIHKNQFDILIGTQIIAKGLDLPDVDLVGIISADTALHFPDYHSGEQTFQVITQVSGRSGRRSKQGTTIIQTYWPDNQAIEAAAKHDYQAFYDKEIEIRKIFEYPPFKKVVRLISQNVDKDKARNIIRSISKALKVAGLEVLGPAPAFYKRIRNRYRYHLIIKIKDSERQKLYNLLKPHSSEIIIDIDPTSML